MKLVSESEVEMDDKDDGLWVGVKDFSVRIMKTEEGIAIDVYTKGHENDDALDCLTVFDPWDG